MMQGKVSSRVALDGDARVATGIPGFDEMLEGGYPAGSLITLAGRPGTGKTIFGSQFLYYGAREHGEPGMYVSMLEGEKTYLRNMRRLGFDIPPLQSKKMFRFLEMPTLTAEGLPAIWEEIVRNIDEFGIVRLITETPNNDSSGAAGMHEFIADGVVYFSLVPVTGDARVRYLEVTKMRGTSHQMGLIPVDIGKRGISVRSPHIPART